MKDIRITRKDFLVIESERGTYLVLGQKRFLRLDEKIPRIVGGLPKEVIEMIDHTAATLGGSFGSIQAPV
ncbi:MAG: hypothetical protein PHQ23_17605, partial [Candidatus Wallbacteria bacterium]|nr:hypothetical protein [Candidatus Wallbacteria bacterium]